MEAPFGGDGEGDAREGVAIVGNGAIGTLFARALQPRTTVVLLGSASDPALVTGYRLVLVALKTYDTTTALRRLREGFERDAVLLTLQNGLDNERRIADATGRIAIAGVTTESATRTGDGTVVRGGIGTTVLPANDNADGFARLLQAAGFAVERTQRIEVALWKKLVANAAINSTTALAGVTNGEIWRDSALRERALAIAGETARIADAQGIAVGDAAAIVETVVRASAANRSSMLQDLERGRRTEADAILGAPLERAHRLNLYVPALEEAYRALRAREA